MEEVLIVNTIYHKLLLSILYTRSCYCQYCIPESVLAQYVVSVDLHITYTKELSIFKMKSGYLTLKIISSCHFMCTYFCIYCLHDIYILYMLNSVENPK